MENVFKKAICPNDCPAACGLLVETNNNQIYSVKGDESHPLFKGLMCQKMRDLRMSVHSSKRIKSPLKRVGKKGEGIFCEVSWEEAIQDIAKHYKDIIKEYGPEAILPISSSGTQGVIQKNSVDAFFNKMNATQIQYSLCSGAKSAALQSVNGGSAVLSPLEMENSDFIIIWGSNVKATLPHAMPVLLKAKIKGTKIIIIDVCADDTYMLANELLLIKPGSDGALALSIMHVLYNEGYIDEKYLEKYASGYQEFLDTLYRYTPAWAAKITGIDEKVIINLARAYGKAKKPCILHGSGNTRRKTGGMIARLIMILSFITKAWSNGGGYVGRGVRNGTCIDMNYVSGKHLRSKDARVENINALCDILNDENRNPQIKAFYLAGGNPVNSFTDQKRVIEGLKREDLFTVVHEREMTDTAKYADYVLPATYSIEHSDIYLSGYYPVFNTSFKCIEPLGLSKSNREVMKLLAKEMGFDDELFDMSDEELIDKLIDERVFPLDQVTEDDIKVLKSGGSVLLEKANVMDFHTSDHKFRICDERLEDYIPCYKEDNGVGLCLIAVPDIYSLNSMFNYRVDLNKKRGPMRVIINSYEASLRNLKEGEQVIVYNDLAQIKYFVEISDYISNGAAVVKGVFGTHQTGETYITNALHHPIYSDIGNGSTLNGNYVEIKKCD